MAKINVLDEQLANQIAAGEVVERPASVVKELVENAVDAGSSEIDVAIEEGGLTLIRVKDNGSGIEPDDMATAFQRHATSKIKVSGDLFRIASLGFRGEALPSIAAVSRVECVSADSGGGLGRRLRIEGGAVAADEPANTPQGTVITVRDLFYNTPARLKYMKSIQTELGHITDYMNRVALAHPGVAITLSHNGNTLLRTQGTGDRLQVVAAVYGTSAAKAMLTLSASDPDYELTGYISKPELTRANRNGITVIVNGRYIRSHAVNQSLLAAYHTLLPINRFPLAVLELGMHPSLLDVNVHPSKMEVRFSKEAELRTLIEKAAKSALKQYRYTPGMEEKKTPRSGPLYVQDAISFHMADTPAARESAAGYAAAERRPQGPARSSGAAGPYAASVTADREAIPRDAAERLYSPPASGRGDAGSFAAAGSGPAAAQPHSESASRSGMPEPSSAPSRPGAAGTNGSPPSDAGFERRQAADEAAKDAALSAQLPEPDHSPRLTASVAASAPLESSAGEPGLPRLDGTSAASCNDGSDAALDAFTASHHDASGAEPDAFAASRPPGAAALSPPEAPAPAKADGSRADEAGGRTEPAFPELHWIGQHHGTYIVAQSEDGLYLIDQHAAHERINYEYYLHKFGNPVAASQGLLVPLTLEFTPGEAYQLRELLPLFREAGVELEPFGSQTFLVRSHPEWFPQGEETAVIEEMAEWIIGERKSVDIGKLREKAAIMCACKASIKANDRMSREEGEALLARLARCAQPYTCPHGRPIIVHLSTYQLEKMFKRVMS